LLRGEIDVAVAVGADEELARLEDTDPASVDVLARDEDARLEDRLGEVDDRLDELEEAAFLP
jgi:hypothetical protein